MSSINANATVTLTVNGKQAQDMLDNLKRKSQDLEKSIENAAKAGDKAKLTRLQKELRQTNRQISQIESATVGVEKVLKNLDRATPKELNKTLSTLRSQLNGIERGTEEWNRQCEAIKRVKAEIAKVNANLSAGEGFWERFNRRINEWQTSLMGAAAAITGLIMAGRSAVKAFADMDAELANVRKFTGMTKEQVEDLNEEFKKMDTRTSREQLNVLAEEAGKLGKTSKEDILGFVKAADKINVALDELGDGATLTLSKLTSIFGDEERLGTERALLSVGSVINELSQNCTAAAPYLANFAKRMAGVGAQAEMTIPQIMGLAAVLDSQGQAVEMSATAVSKLIMDMFKQQDKIIKATGVNAEKFKEALTRSTNEGLLVLLERLHELGNIDVLAPVFKDMGENGARAAQVISALAGNIDMVKWEQEEIPNYNAMLDTTSGKYKANKEALDDYVNSLVKMYEIMGAKDKLKELGAQKADLLIKKSQAEEDVAERQHAVNVASSPIVNTQYDQLGTPGTRMMARSVNSGENRARSALTRAQSELNDINSQLDEIALKEKRITDIWGEELQKRAVTVSEEPETTDPDIPTVPSGGTGKSSEERFREEKEWKEREEALNRISYATGQKNYEQYTRRMTEIEVEYQDMVLQRTDLTEQERLNAQAAYYEAQLKQTEQGMKMTAEQENQLYSEAVALQKQRYIDGEIDTQTYQETLEILELRHLQRMVSIYKKGTNEYLQAQRAYQDKLIADQQRRQKETEDAERKHQDRMKKIKDQFFGDNQEERVMNYNADLEALKQLYEMEINAAGDSAKEKLRIEKAYQKAKKALRKQYGIDELDDNRNFLEEWTSDMQEWLQSDMGKAVTGSLEVISSGMGSIFQQLSSLVQAETDIQVAAIEKRYKAEISNAEGNNYQVKKLEKQKENEIAKVKNNANKKMFKMQVMQAIAQTATAALNAYSSAAAVPVVGYILAPIAAATAVAAGMLQVEAIKKQQEAANAQGYAEGGFTGEGGKFDVAGVVHKGEWVASQQLLKSPVTRPLIEALDYAQRNNTIGSLRSEDVSRTLALNYAQASHIVQTQPAPTVIVQQPGSNAQTDIAATYSTMREFAGVIKQLRDRLNEPFVTVNTVTGDTGIKQAQDEYDLLMRNKTPKSRRSS